MFRSVSLIRYQTDHKVLSLVAKDLRPFTPSPMSAQFLLDRQHLVFVLSDENGNLSIFSYLPESPESRGGENLILLGSLNIGSASNGIVRVNGKQFLKTLKLETQFLGHANGPFLEARDTIQETQTNIISTLDGSWAVLRPISERTFRRLQILQQLMLSQVPQCAGLNARGCRAAKPQKLLQQPKSSTRSIIDGNFVFQFMNLNTSTKAELARASGSNRYQIIDDITEFRRACTHF
jgi:cleavage and polyadenylation specificity factor subunit 1